MEKFEALIVIVNEGFSEQVMKVARENGARGGTISNARGTANKEMEKKYGIVITPQKEMIYIILDTKIKDKVMSEVNKECGLDTPACGLLFSLPISNVSGIKTE